MNILTFDIEEPWHIIPRNDVYESVCKPFDLSRFADELNETIDIEKVTPVLFWVGTVASRNKSLLREFAEAGYQIGCHGYDHEDYASLSGRDLTDTLSRAKKHLEDIVGQDVTAFRAPAFSVGDLDEFWGALEDTGYTLDFSVCDAARFAGGGHGTGLFAPTRLSGRNLTEFPMSYLDVAGRKLYVTGGGYFRITPYFALKKVHLERAYNMYYLHPVDFMRPEIHGEDPRTISQKVRQKIRVGDPWKKLKATIDLGQWHVGPMHEWAEQYG